MLKRIALIALAGLAATGFAAEPRTQREAETKQAEAEEAAAREKNSENIFSDFAGKVTLYGKEQKDDNAESGVVGTFSTEKTVYLIKLASEKLLEKLKEYDGKMCTVNGKIRNAEKYIIVRKIELAGAENIFKKRRGGLGM